MKAHRRIIPISSGKGGVGKTTFAINFALALSRHGRTVLVDVDTGTSSVRNCLDTPVEKDLYHFFRKGRRLEDCITTLSPRLDPRGVFADFGFVAAPRHFIEEVSNLDERRRDQLIDALNGLDAAYVVLDLKAGLDHTVLDFLPFSNSGVLVFTPYLPAATMAAADIVKGALFRKLRAMFAAGSPVYQDLKGVGASFVNGLIDRVEDVYDAGVHNLDAFASDLRHALGDAPVVRLVSNAIDGFLVYFVLNMFNGVRESYDTAVKPFVETLSDNVSSHLTLLNLGWVVAHQEINEANMRRMPVLLGKPGRPAARGQDAASKAASAELQRLARRYVGPRPGSERQRDPVAYYATPDASRSLNVQLDTLRRMHADLRGDGYRDNFKYIVYRALHMMSSRRPSDFGDTRIFKRSEIQQAMARRAR